jgi:hypothetical protein
MHTCARTCIHAYMRTHMHARTCENTHRGILTRMHTTQNDVTNTGECAACQVHSGARGAL